MSLSKRKFDIPTNVYDIQSALFHSEKKLWLISFFWEVLYKLIGSIDELFE